MRVFQVVLCAVLVAGATATGCGFGYDGDLGPDHWGDEYKECLGKHQSPINIDSHHVTRTVFPPLKMEGFFSLDDRTILQNNGHTAMMSTDSTAEHILSGGPLNGEYVFSQLHFHWGDSDDHGSEDLVDGVSYPMEMHLVFYKKEYLDATSALDYPDGLCVVAVLFEIGDEHNHNYDGFVDVLRQIIEPDTEAVFENPPVLADLLPKDKTHYFTYNGSLTTPPCSEVVTWIDLKQHVRLSHDQFEDFRALRNEEDESMSNNFRAVQPLGDRIVYYNVFDYEHHIDKDELREQLAKEIENLMEKFQKLLADALDLVFSRHSAS